MTTIPRVTVETRERVSREFDDLGPKACVGSVLEDLRANNPELLEIVTKCARDIERASPDESSPMIGLCMFYRLLTLQSQLDHLLNTTGIGMAALPRVTPEVRDLIVRQIDEQGVEAFTRSSLDRLEHENPELLQMAHAFALRRSDYLPVMQGFVLLYACLSAQVEIDRSQMH